MEREYENRHSRDDEGTNTDDFINNNKNLSQRKNEGMHASGRLECVMDALEPALSSHANQKFIGEIFDEPDAFET